MKRFINHCKSLFRSGRHRADSRSDHRASGTNRKLAIVLPGFLILILNVASLEARTVVIHLEDATVQAGFAGEASPRLSMPAVIGRSKNTGPMIGMMQKRVYVGKEALARKSTLNLSYIIQNGDLQDHDGLESILHHLLYNELKVEPEDSAVLIAHSPQMSKANREKIMQILFETFNVPAAYLSWDPPLALYAAKNTSGIVVQQGANFTTVTSVYEGYMARTVRMDGKGDLPSMFKQVLDPLPDNSRQEAAKHLLVVGPAATDPAMALEQLAAVASGEKKPNILSVARASQASWRGGAILSALSTFSDMWVSKDEYDETGPSIVHRKCN